MNKPIEITILGGGLAGLSVGYYARKKGLPFTVYEAGNRIGGNCITLTYRDFHFDSGAHRLHDKDTEVTKELKSLLGEDLKEINVPSQIYHKGTFVDFPLSPWSLLRNLGPYTFVKAGLELVGSKLRSNELNGNFENFALHTYGKNVDDNFLLNYSEKLWGLPCNRLSPNIAGKRMKGLNLRTFLTEAILGRIAKTEHSDGSFYYPKWGSVLLQKNWENFAGRKTFCEMRRLLKFSTIIHEFRR